MQQCRLLSKIKKTIKYSSAYFDYSKDQHSIDFIPLEFNSQTGESKIMGIYQNWPSDAKIYSGFEHYLSRNLNAYFWSLDNYVNSDVFDLIVDIHRDITKLISLTQIKKIMKATFDEAQNLVKSSFLPKEGVQIVDKSSDGSTVIIWGTTNFNDVVYAGFGNNRIYLFAGDDICYDSGGYDTYIFPASYYGINLIYDTGNQGLIIIGDVPLRGTIHRILRSECDLNFSDDSYMLITNDKKNTFYLKYQGGRLAISSNYYSTENVIYLENYQWGGFDFNEPSNTDQGIVIGSCFNRLYCLLPGCILASAEDVTQVLEGFLEQNIRMYGSIRGQKIFKMLKSANSNPGGRSLQEVIPDSGNTFIVSIKGGDFIDLSNITNFAETLTFVQNGTDIFMNISSYSIHVSAVETNFVSFTVNETGIVVDDIDIEIPEINTVTASVTQTYSDTSMKSTSTVSKTDTHNPSVSGTISGTIAFNVTDVATTVNPTTTKMTSTEATTVATTTEASTLAATSTMPASTTTASLSGTIAFNVTDVATTVNSTTTKMTSTEATTVATTTEASTLAATSTMPASTTTASLANVPASTQEIKIMNGTYPEPYIGNLDSETIMISSEVKYANLTLGGGNDRVILMPSINSWVDVMDFTRDSVIDLSAFNYTKFEDLQMTKGSANIHLPGNQTFSIRNMYPEDLETSNFIFPQETATNPPGTDDGVSIAAIVGGVIGGVIGLTTVGLVTYHIVKHLKRNVEVTPISPAEYSTPTDNPPAAVIPVEKPVDVSGKLYDS